MSSGARRAAMQKEARSNREGEPRGLSCDIEGSAGRFRCPPITRDVVATIRCVPPRLRMSFLRAERTWCAFALEAYNITFAYLRACARHSADLEGYHNYLHPCVPVFCACIGWKREPCRVLSRTNRCTSIHGLEDVLRSSFPSHTPQLRTAVPARPTQAARPPTRRDNSEVDHEDESAPIAYQVGRIRDPSPRSSSGAAAGASGPRSPVRYISARALRVVPHAHGSRGMHLPSMHDERSCVCARRGHARKTMPSSLLPNCSSSAPPRHWLLPPARRSARRRYVVLLLHTRPLMHPLSGR
ncbi:hypothetical protein B0H13DRAFT_1053144 [Mycena leptocephala]|nr:hypothetical protein B0H13DRAFT_1053144 [Mycena leptocephala]